MPRLTLPRVFGRLSRLVETPSRPPTPDQELLARFLERHDEQAFAAIMERHAAMVLGLCRRILKNAHDAEDACQAVFLVLARRAASIRKTGSLASWLHGVAWHIAHKLRTGVERRVAHESSAATEKPAVSEPGDISWLEVQRLVDEELTRLPMVYQAPLVLCYLEGRSQEEAARELGWSLGSLRGRLERGREMLRARLTRRGVTGAAGLAIAVLLPSVGSAATPTLIASTAAASVPMAAGGAIPATVPAPVAALTREALQTPVLTKLAVGSVAGLIVLCLAMVLATFGWPAAELPRVPEPDMVEVWSEASRLEVPNGHVWSVAFSPDGKRIAAGSGGPKLTSGELRLWDADTQTVLYVVETSRSVRCVVFAPDGKTLATAEHDGVARLREASTGKVLFTLKGHKTQVDSVAFAADGKTLATTGWDQTVKLWDTATGAHLRALTGHRDQVFTVTFGGPDGALASGGVDTTAKIWRPTGEPIFTLSGHSGVVHWLSFSPDGKTLATASWDKTVKLWDAEAGKPIATLRGHTESALAVAFSPDGKTLASSAGRVRGPDVVSPGEVILWDLAAQKPRARFNLNDRVYGLAFSPDSSTLATAGWDGVITLWKEEPNRQPRQANGDPHRDLHFVLAAAQPEDVGMPPAKEYAEDYHPSLKDNTKDIPGLMIFGPDAAECVKFGPEGLHITLPEGFPRHRSGTGVVTDFAVKGDFEITMSYEILQEPRPGTGGNPTDLRLVIVPNEHAKPGLWHKSTQNRAILAREAAGRFPVGQFAADTTRWNNVDVPKDQWGNEIFDKIEAHDILQGPATAKTGQLRLVRSGPMLFFLTSENNKDFTPLHKVEFGAKDLKSVRLLAATGGPGISFDVRVTDLRIRADSFPKATAPPAPAPVAEIPRRAHLWWLLALAVVVPVIFAAVALGLWLVVRSRRTIAPTRQFADAAAPSTIAFVCPSCGKRLKTKAERAGKKLNCPQCAKAVQVPAAEEPT